MITIARLEISDIEETKSIKLAKGKFLYEVLSVTRTEIKGPIVSTFKISAKPETNIRNIIGKNLSFKCDGKNFIKDKIALKLEVFLFDLCIILLNVNNFKL